MTIEEAIKRIKAHFDKWALDDEDIKAIQTLIPELHESEDERIRKALIDALKVSETIGELKFRLPYPTREECIAYLEKQQERNPINHNLTTWHRDVVYCAMCDKNLDEGLRCNLEVVYKTIKELVDRTPVVEEQKSDNYSEERKLNHEWTSEDWSMLCDIRRYIEGTGSSSGITNQERAAWLCKLPKRFSLEGKEQKPAEWSEEDEGELQNAIDALEFLGKKGVYKSESGYDAALQAASWLKSLPERFVPQSKQEWSEEDADMLNCCISSIEEAKENRYAYKETDGDTSYDREIDWLKSLRPHKNSPIMVDADQLLKILPPPSWKPSKEQIATLEQWLKDKQFDGDSRYVYPIFESLYNDLKKLIAKKDRI